MAKQVSTFNYRKHCISQGRDNIPTLTRKQKKALKQHDAAQNKRVGMCAFKRNTHIVTFMDQTTGEIVVEVGRKVGE